MGSIRLQENLRLEGKREYRMGIGGGAREGGRRAVGGGERGIRDGGGGGGGGIRGGGGEDGDEREQKVRERPRRVIGDGNIYGLAPTTFSSDSIYKDNDSHLVNATAEDNEQDVEAALALALPTSPVTDSVPLRTVSTAPAASRISGVPTQPAEWALTGHQNSTILREDVDPFQTSLGFTPGFEASVAYVALPPVGALAVLMLEHRSDYVRYVVLTSTR